jgi:hypothetical protein
VWFSLTMVSYNKDIISGDFGINFDIDYFILKSELLDILHIRNNSVTLFLQIMILTIPYQTNYCVKYY